MDGSAKHPWPASNPEERPTAALRAYARNSRTHSAEQVALIAASITEWGFTQPILVDPDGEVIAGHGRLAAAVSLGLESVPVIVARGWSEAQKRAYVIADNKLAEHAGWDEALLAEEVRALEGDFDLGLLGFDDADLGALLNPGTGGNTDPDAAPAVEDAAVSRRGETWLLGRHRLRCGDSTDPADVDALLGEVRPHLMVTDPPYGVEYDPAWRQRAGVAGKVATGKVRNDDKADWRSAWELFPGNVAYVWHGALHALVVTESLVAAGFEVRAQIVWVKQRPALSRGHYHWQHEPAFYAERNAEPSAAPGLEVTQEGLAYIVRAGKTANWCGDRRQSTVWFVEHLKNDTGHGTQKPVECMRRPIVNNSSPGQAVYEPFSGSGTTLIAGEMEGRSVLAMEIDERYVDVAVRRWQEFTGAIATLEGDGRGFAEIAAERAVA